MSIMKKIIIFCLSLAPIATSALTLPGFESPVVRVQVTGLDASIADAFTAFADGGTQVGEFFDKGFGRVISSLSDKLPDLFSVLNENTADGLTLVDERSHQTTEIIAGVAERLKNTFKKNNNDISQNILKNSLRVVLPVGASLVGFFIAGYVAKKYVTKYLYEPKLIAQKKSTSFFASLFSRKKILKPINELMVIDKKLEDQLNLIIGMTKNVKKNGGTFDHALLHGAPGTGKTLFAEYLAQSCGMAYALIPAANVSQFLASGKAVEELNNLFEWAAAQPTGTVLFFDEAETFLGDRKNLSFEAQNALNAFLAQTGTPSNKIMIICATNRPEVLDAAVLSRCGMKIEFPLADRAGRKAQLDMHIHDIFDHQTKGKVIAQGCLADESYRELLAQKLENCSGRTIQKFVNRLRQQALAENKNQITDELVERVLVRV